MGGGIGDEEMGPPADDLTEENDEHASEDSANGENAVPSPIANAPMTTTIEPPPPEIIRHTLVGNPEHPHPVVLAGLLDRSARSDPDHPLHAVTGSLLFPRTIDTRLRNEQTQNGLQTGPFGVRGQRISHARYPEGAQPFRRFNTPSPQQSAPRLPSPPEMGPTYRIYRREAPPLPSPPRLEPPLRPAFARMRNPLEETGSSERSLDPPTLDSPPNNLDHDWTLHMYVPGRREQVDVIAAGPGLAMQRGRRLADIYRYGDQPGDNDYVPGRLREGRQAGEDGPSDEESSREDQRPVVFQRPLRVVRPPRVQTAPEVQPLLQSIERAMSAVPILRQMLGTALGVSAPAVMMRNPPLQENDALPPVENTDEGRRRRDAGGDEVGNEDTEERWDGALYTRHEMRARQADIEEEERQAAGPSRLAPPPFMIGEMSWHERSPPIRTASERPHYRFEQYQDGRRGIGEDSVDPRFQLVLYRETTPGGIGRHPVGEVGRQWEIENGRVFQRGRQVYNRPRGRSDGALDLRRYINVVRRETVRPILPTTTQRGDAVPILPTATQQDTEGSILHNANPGGPVRPQVPSVTRGDVSRPQIPDGNAQRERAGPIFPTLLQLRQRFLADNQAGPSRSLRVAGFDPDPRVASAATPTPEAPAAPIAATLSAPATAIVNHVSDCPDTPSATLPALSSIAPRETIRALLPNGPISLPTTSNLFGRTQIPAESVARPNHVAQTSQSAPSIHPSEASSEFVAPSQPALTPPLESALVVPPSRPHAQTFDLPIDPDALPRAPSADRHTHAHGLPRPSSVSDSPPHNSRGAVAPLDSSEHFLDPNTSRLIRDYLVRRVGNGTWEEDLNQGGIPSVVFDWEHGWDEEVVEEIEGWAGREEYDAGEIIVVEEIVVVDVRGWNEEEGESVDVPIIWSYAPEGDGERYGDDWNEEENGENQVRAGMNSSQDLGEDREDWDEEEERPGPMFAGIEDMDAQLVWEDPTSNDDPAFTLGGEGEGESVHLDDDIRGVDNEAITPSIMDDTPTIPGSSTLPTVLPTPGLGTATQMGSVLLLHEYDDMVIADRRHWAGDVNQRLEQVLEGKVEAEVDNEEEGGLTMKEDKDESREV